MGGILSFYICSFFFFRYGFGKFLLVYYIEIFKIFYKFWITRKLKRSWIEFWAIDIAHTDHIIFFFVFVLQELCAYSHREINILWFQAGNHKYWRQDFLRLFYVRSGTFIRYQGTHPHLKSSSGDIDGSFSESWLAPWVYPVIV